MNSGRYVLTQVLDLIHRQALDRLAERYNIRARHFGCRQQLICMGFAQLTWRESLRDIEECLNAKGAGAFFVTRAKDNLRFSRIGSNPKIFGSGVSSDQVGHPTRPKAREAFPWPLLRIRFVDPDTGKQLVFLTNHLEVPAETVAALYKNRWQIEHFFGTSPNAVKTQVWIAVSIYVLIAILHKELKLPRSLHRTLQILSVHPFEKIPLHQLLAETPDNFMNTHDPNQLWLW